MDSGGTEGGDTHSAIPLLNPTRYEPFKDSLDLHLNGTIWYYLILNLML